MKHGELHEQDLANNLDDMIDAIFDYDEEVRKSDGKNKRATSDNELVFKDISARIPYHQKYQCDGYEGKVYTVVAVDDTGHVKAEDEAWDPVEIVKMYLRPFSSMTHEEMDEYNTLVDGFLNFENAPRLTEWLIEHHFDYHGLIEKGLALEAPEGMYD